MLGLTFKENCPDLRNSKVADLVRELKEYGCDVAVHDPIAESAEAVHEYNIALTPWDQLPEGAEAIVAAVAHANYLERPFSELTSKLRRGGIFVDVKSAYEPTAVRDAGFMLWRL